MSEDPNAWGFLRMLTWQHVLLVLAVFLSARLLSFVVRWLLRHAAEKARPRLRLSILRNSGDTIRNSRLAPLQPRARAAERG